MRVKFRALVKSCGLTLVIRVKIILNFTLRLQGQGISLRFKID
jgi:hypothetical protein